jgi:hypothetical protein
MAIDWVTLGPILARIVADLLAAERSRTGLTDAEIFQRAGVKIDQNETRLLEDITRLTMDTEP